MSRICHRNNYDNDDRQDDAVVYLHETRISRFGGDREREIWWNQQQTLDLPIKVPTIEAYLLVLGTCTFKYIHHTKICSELKRFSTELNEINKYSVCTTQCGSIFPLPPVKRSDRSEAGCTPEMPANLWAPPPSEGGAGGAFGTLRETFSHCPPCHLWLPIIVSNLNLTYVR